MIASKPAKTKLVDMALEQKAVGQKALGEELRVEPSLVNTLSLDTSSLNRRSFLVGVSVAAVAVGGNRAVRAETTTAATEAAAVGPSAAAGPAPLIPTAHYEQALQTIVGTGTPIEGRVALELPEDAENGNIVPYKIAVESPMTDEDHIVRVHLLSTQNPQASVATFHFTPLSGKATVSGRMRLAKTQEVVAIALTSSNTLLIGRQLVAVGIGGCGSE